MQHIKRLLWLLLAGFTAAAGASIAIAIAIVLFQEYSDERRKTQYKPDQRNYQPPPPGEVQISGLTVIEVTRNGGVRGTITNGTKRNLKSFNANLSFFKKEELLYTCNETVMVDVEPGKSARFQLLCKEVERSALSAEITPKLSLVWVYPSLDE
jgi:hypothetical protein